MFLQEKWGKIKFWLQVWRFFCLPGILKLVYDAVKNLASFENLIVQSLQRPEMSNILTKKCIHGLHVFN